MVISVNVILHHHHLPYIGLFQSDFATSAPKGSILMHFGGISRSYFREISQSSCHLPIYKHLNLHLRSLTARPRKMMVVQRSFPCGDGNSSGANSLLNFQGVIYIIIQHTVPITPNLPKADFFFGGAINKKRTYRHLFCLFFYIYTVFIWYVYIYIIYIYVHPDLPLLKPPMAGGFRVRC